MRTPRPSAADIPIAAQPMAQGQPIGRATADAAADWLTLLMSGEVTEDDRRRWQQWRGAHADHERAWQHVEAVAARFRALEGNVAYRSLSASTPSLTLDAQPPRGRRKALRALAWIGVAGAAGVLASRTSTWQQTLADHRTGTGERRSIRLEDGTVMVLNTASAIDVRFDAGRRLVRLVAGEVLITTGHAAAGAASADARPFLVESAGGTVRALGTRFVVRRFAQRTHVAVLEGAVEIAAGEALPGLRRVLSAGASTSFGRDAIDPDGLVNEETTLAWTRGQLIADDMRLDDLLAELGRYRSGVLRCEPALAGLRLSGVFPLDDTDRVLAMLPDTLPVQVHWRTRYWVTVEAAS